MTERPAQSTERQRQELVAGVLELSNNGELVWDFKYFEDSVRGRVAHSRYNRLIFVSGDSLEGGVDFSIILEEPYGLTTEIDSFRGTMAQKIRLHLEDLARAHEESKDLELFREKKQGLVLASNMLQVK